MLQSWKTSVAGILQFLALGANQIMLLIDGNDLTNPDYGLLFASLMTLIGLLRARDNDVSSENAGAK